MYQTTFLDFIPLWAVFFGSALLVVASIEAGVRIGLWRAKRTKKSDLPHTGGAVAATLGLLGFMMAFTFGSTTTRWDDRKGLVLDESNAIGTAYLRADLLPEPQRSNARQLLEAYLELRLDLRDQVQRDELTGVERLMELERAFASALGESGELQNRLWQEAMTAYRVQPTPGTNLFITAVNEMFDIQQSRVTKAIYQRMPLVFWLTLYALAMLAMGLSGYDAGLARGGRTRAPWVVALAFSSVLLLIVALDRPQTSGVDLAPLMDLHKSITSKPG